MLKIQSAVIDVADWEQDEFAVFPQGARPKEAYFSPGASSESCLKPSWRYLFKKSKQCYPEQFWAEVIAYRIGCLMGLPVPPAFAAVNSKSGTCGALIEWFFDDTTARFVHAGDFLQQIYPEFDRQKGTTHTIQYNSNLLRILVGNGLLKTDWRLWWAEALLFDALIGNTDRHQDNWGFIFGSASADDNTAVMAPLFDNGTSLGHEHFTKRTSSWGDVEFERYISKGYHQVRRNLEDAPPLRDHLRLLQHTIEQWQNTRTPIRERIHSIAAEALEDSFCDLLTLPLPTPLTPLRFEFTLKLLQRRLTRLKTSL